jgi:hypothetical protein
LPLQQFDAAGRRSRKGSLSGALRETRVRGSWNRHAVGAAFLDAAVDPSRWDAAMEIASEGTGSFGAALFPLKGNLPGVPHTPDNRA